MSEEPSDEASDKASDETSNDETVDETVDAVAPVVTRRTRRTRSRKRVGSDDDAAPALSDEAAITTAVADADAVSDAETEAAETEAKDVTDAAPRSRRRRGRKRTVKPGDAAAASGSAPSEPDGNRNTVPETPPVDADGNVGDTAPDTEAPASQNAGKKQKPPRRAGRGYSNRVVY